jgi:fructose/tagatose bisphosphate aldolase
MAGFGMAGFGIESQMQFQHIQSYWDIPGMKAGVVTGKVAWHLLQYCKAKGLGIPASICADSNNCNTVLGEAAKRRVPAYIHVSDGSASLFAGKGNGLPCMHMPNDKGKYSDAILGACVCAHYVRSVAQAYGIPVFVDSVDCTKELMPWFDGMLKADEVFFQEHGEALFTSHMMDLSESEEPHEEKVGIYQKYFKKMAKVNLIMEIGVHNAEGSNMMIYPSDKNTSCPWELVFTNAQQEEMKYREEQEELEYLAIHYTPAAEAAVGDEEVELCRGRVEMEGPRRGILAYRTSSRT